MLGKIIFFAQLFVSAALIILILLQERSSGIGSSLGGASEFYQTRRGLEKLILMATIVLAVIFGLLAIASLLYKA